MLPHADRTTPDESTANPREPSHRSRDLTGQRFGRLEVIRRGETGRRTQWICRCDCGAVKSIDASHLISGGSRSCGRGHPRHDLTGRRFDRLLVLSLADRGRRARWNCRCDCGATKVVMAQSLLNGDARSCGCLGAELRLRRAEANRRPEAERFWEKVDKSGDCWLWTGSRNEKGYGSFGGADGKLCPAHRKSYELSVGPIPDGLWVLHRCDNPPCVNPAHLFLGDRQANVDDMMAKGRNADNRGERGAKAKLTVAIVFKIRTDYMTGVETSWKRLMKRHRIGKTTVRQILNGTTWDDPEWYPDGYKEWLVNGRRLAR